MPALDLPTGTLKSRRTEPNLAIMIYVAMTLL